MDHAPIGKLNDHRVVRMVDRENRETLAREPLERAGVQTATDASSRREEHHRPTAARLACWGIDGGSCRERGQRAGLQAQARVVRGSHGIRHVGRARVAAPNLRRIPELHDQRTRLFGGREGVEAALIVSIILAYLAKTGNQRHFGRIWIGSGAAILLSIVVGAVLWFSIEGLEGAAGQIFEVAGPTVYTLRELVEYVSALVGCPRPIIPLPEALAMLQARLMELAPEPLMSRDNVRSLRVDNVAHGAPLPFGLTPTALEAVVPGWLGEGGSRARYYPFRRQARRG